MASGSVTSLKEDANDSFHSKEIHMELHSGRTKRDNSNNNKQKETLLKPVLGSSPLGRTEDTGVKSGVVEALQDKRERGPSETVPSKGSLETSSRSDRRPDQEKSRRSHTSSRYSDTNDRRHSPDRDHRRLSSQRRHGDHRRLSRSRSRERRVERRHGDRHRSRSRERRHRRSRSRDRPRHRNRSRSRSHSQIVEKGRRPSVSNQKSSNGETEPHAKSHNDKTNELPEELAKPISLSNEKPSNLPLNDLVLIPKTGTVITAQMAVQQTMAAMSARAQQLTGVTLPKYYNPAAVNPLKYAEQMQKRKLLWHNKEKKDANTMATWEKTTFSQDQDGKMAAKFRKLMGIKEDGKQPPTVQAVDEDHLRKQEELFRTLDKQYEVARISTHTQRGVGLGFSSIAGTPVTTMITMPQQPTQQHLFPK